MKKKLFISYSSSDEEKVAIVARELADNSAFEAVIIASNREPLKPLAQKVMDGIEESWCVVPILTQQSIRTQWINQEIGFARGINRRVAPIVEKSVIDELKGFIHREVDLPYSYTSHDTHEAENEGFICELRNLLTDLELQLSMENSSQTDVSPPISQSEFEKALANLDAKRGAEAFAQQKNAYFNSKEGEDATKKEFGNLVAIVSERVDEMTSKGLDVVLDKHPLRLSIVVKGGGHSVTFGIDSVLESNRSVFQLWVVLWKGHFSFTQGIYIHPPKRLKESIYEADLNPNHHFTWKVAKSGASASSMNLVDESLAWLIERIIKPSPEFDDQYNEDEDDDYYG